MLLSGVGKKTLLSAPMTAFFASRQCSGFAIRAAMDWALQQVKTRQVVISGFHSPLERSILEVLLTAAAPVVIALVQDPGCIRLPALWKHAAHRGTLAIIGPAKVHARLTNELASARNDWVTKIAMQTVIAHAAPAGGLATQVKHWQKEGRPIVMLSS